MFFSVYTLGCKLNQLETEAITDSFCREGFSFIPWEHSATKPAIMVINTCTVTSMAEQKARRIIRKAMRDHPDACFIVTGCYAQMEAATLAALGEGANGRFFVIPGERKDHILDIPRFLARSANILTKHASEETDKLPEQIALWLDSLDADRSIEEHSIEKNPFRFRPENFASHSRAFLKIQDGCDRSCAYCRVSLARGKSRSLGAREALEELLSLEKRGFTEAVLTGVNISQYRDSGMNLWGLLEFLLAKTDAIRLRLSSIEPESSDWESGNFARILANKRIRPHFHLSLQSGSATILEKMGRPYTPSDIEKVVALLREVREDPFLACDIIAGFPGEDALEFGKTREFCEKAGFAWIHAFPFSPRPGTAAYSLSEKVSEKDAAERVNILTGLARKGRREYIARWEGKEVETVVEAGENLPESYVSGVSENYLKLCIICGDKPLPAPGSLVKCRIVGAHVLGKAENAGKFDALAEVRTGEKGGLINSA